MTKPSAKDLFDFMNEQVTVIANKRGEPTFRAFPRWFAEMYYAQPEEMLSCDGAGDGKVDFFFHTVLGNKVKYHVINSKFTSSYNQTAPVGFYDEVLSFYQLFSSSVGRGTFLQKKVRQESIAWLSDFTAEGISLSHFSWNSL